MPKISPAREELRRQHIVAAAARCFTREGYGATTMDGVCREASVSKGGLYTYFKSKEELFAEVCREEWMAGFEQLARAVAAEPTVEAKLKKYGEFAFAKMAEGAVPPDDLGLMSLAIWQEAARNPEVRDVVLQGYRLWFSALRTLMEEGQRSGEIRSELDPEALVATLIAIFDGFRVARAVGGPSIDLERLQDTVLNFVRAGILTEPRT